MTVNLALPSIFIRLRHSCSHQESIKVLDLTCIVYFFYPQLSRMMGLDVIARKREWHVQPCSKDDIESAQQGLSKLVTFMSPHIEEATEQNQI